jgi:Protein of unknown function (DUF4011)/REase_MTES_1575/Protein of unknown function (DUF3320)/AAA domain
MTRPLFSETMADLQARADRNRDNVAELDLLRSELMHRSTQSARSLRGAVEQQIAKLKTAERRGIMPTDAPEPDLEIDMDAPTATPAPNLSLRKLFDDTRKRLVETGTRNRLVHVNRANTKGNVLNIINERSDDVFALLSGGRKMRFLAIGKDKADTADDVHLYHAGHANFDDARYGDTQLEVKLGPDALEKRLLKIAREARTAEEEQGINILYLGLGFMTWFEDKVSAVPREAPLILLPVELKRNERTSTYDVQIRGDDIVTNLPLARRLKEDFGLELPDIEVGESWQPSEYFNQVEEAITGRERWKVDRDGMQMGFFSFAKLLMYLDLDPERWPDGSLEKHGLVNGLLHEGFSGEEPSIGAQDRLDEILPPSAIFHVVNADSSQTKVIEEVRRGRNLVVQGPPGTGKSQTITNIIATAAREGKSVLFVAEKMAALSVVHDRLVKTGLSNICLELHSKASNKKAVLAELGRTLTAAGAVPNVPGPPENLTSARDNLNGIAAALHAPIGDTGETPFGMLARQSRYLGMGITPPTLQSDYLPQMPREHEDAHVDGLEQIGRLLAELGAPDEHAFRGISKFDLQPVDLERFNLKLIQAQQALGSFQDIFGIITSALELQLPCTFEQVVPLLDVLARLEGMPVGSEGSIETILSADDKPRLMETLGEGAQWRDRFDAVQPYFVEAAFASPAAHMRGPLVAGESSFFARLGSAYRNASKELAGLLIDKLPKKAGDRLALLDDLLEVQARHGRWNEDEGYCRKILGDAWRGSRTNFSLLNETAQWALHLCEADIQLTPTAAVAAAIKPDTLLSWQQRLSECAKIAQAETDSTYAVVELDEQPNSTLVDAIMTRMGAMSAAIPDYQKWSNYCQIVTKLDVAGLSNLTARMKSDGLTGERAATELRFARAEHLWNRAIADNSALQGLRDFNRHDLVETYQDLEKKQFKNNVTSILAQHLSQVPRGAQGEMRIIHGELGKRRAHIALRKLFTTAPQAIRRIKPILLMSPISVAQFLEPGLHEFDLLVIDEASQVRPEDALGAIARARQIVVVGDQKQLPPTSFFDRLLGDGEDDEDDEDLESEDLLGGAAKLGQLESVLSLCEARGLGSRMLEWHYRSRDPSLIKVSNREFYKNELILPPSPLQDDPAYGLCFTKVDGAYDRGGKRDNRKEGEAIITRIRDHAHATPKLSLGVVTFSSAQRNLITELLELARRQDNVLDEFLREGKSEDFFVKNIENVQGDERDVILVSVGYGPTVSGGPLTSMSFGPVNSDGGERRLNVLFTRARLRCEIFASFEPSAMDTSRVTREGPKILKRFLEFAQSGILSDAEITGEEADSPFEEDVADAVRALGFTADHQVGSAGFKIDLGIRDPARPGTYILAIECDGATYHSALWARERDRLRQGVLEHLGWRFHRIWSTDWFYNRVGEIKRLAAALEDARATALRGLEVPGSNKLSPQRPADPVVGDIEIPDTVERQMPPYQRAKARASRSHEPHEVHPSVLAELVEKIIDAEGPIHQDEVSRRVAEAFGKERAGARILSTTVKALRRARQNADNVRDDDEFWFTPTQQKSPPVRNRAAEQGPTLKAENISLMEIEAALSIAREDNAGGSDDELVRYAAQLLGFRRVGPELRVRLQMGLPKR